MDLHVVEVRIAHTWGRPDGTLRLAPEWRTFRDAGIYAPAERVSYAPVALEADELAEDPVDDLALLGGRIAHAVADGARAGSKLLMIGGNCTCVPGMFGGLQEAHGPAVKIGLVWVDAHGDFNTPRTTPGGILGGMPVAVVAGLCLPAWRAGARIQTPTSTDRILMVGVRDLKPGEDQLVDASDITMVGIDAASLGEHVERLARETDVLYVHVDLDILDPALIPAHMAHAPNGPSIEQTVSAIGSVLDSGHVDAFALVSLYATRPGGEQSVSAAIDILRPCIERWAASSGAAVA